MKTLKIVLKSTLRLILGTIFIFTSAQGSDDSLTPEPPYDYKKHFNVSTPAQWEEGNQILHSKSTNKPIEKNPAALEFVKTYMIGAKALESDADVLRFASDVANKDGFFLEMGVGMGRTINFIAALNPTKPIHGFDSFEGLPQDWDKGDKVIAKGTFARTDPTYVPPVLRNVRLYEGLFSTVLPKFKTQILGDAPIAFLHIDCDSYTPTKETFSILKENIRPGAVIAFDELYNYSKYEEHEWKAFQEFLTETGYKFEPLAYNINHEQVAVRIK